MNVAVFCASSSRIDAVYMECARELGRLLGEGGHQLVYGGTNQGLMKEVADATTANGGRVIGIIPECIYSRGVAAEGVDELIVAPDMKERKHLLRERADAFIALPGGWGTLEEISEVISLKQLRQLDKPVVFLNVAGFYDGFFGFMEQAKREGFISERYIGILKVVKTPAEALFEISHYTPFDCGQKY